jgi:tRNA uracil 4-sulfurtransferase
VIYNKILLRTGEIFLKGKNRHIFENKLINNIKKIVGKKPLRLRFRYILDYFPEHSKIKQVFGLTSYSLAVETNKDLEIIKKEALALMKDKKGTFKVESKRADKTFSLTSPELSGEIGGHILDNTSLKLSLKNPEHILKIEINQEGAYLYDNTINCFSGIPTETEGSVISLITDKKSYLSTLLFMKRGCKVYPLSFEDHDISKISNYSPSEMLLKRVKTITEIEQFAQEKNISVIVTANNFNEKLETSLIEFKPLITYSEDEIEKKINEFNLK